MVMEKVDITKRTPTLEDCGKTFLCIVRSCGMFQRYELAAWFNPLEDEDLAGREPHEMPHFSIENKYCGQQALDRDVTHWFELPELPYRIEDSNEPSPSCGTMPSILTCSRCGTTYEIVEESHIGCCTMPAEHRTSTICRGELTLNT